MSEREKRATVRIDSETPDEFKDLLFQTIEQSEFMEVGVEGNDFVVYEV